MKKIQFLFIALFVSFSLHTLAQVDKNAITPTPAEAGFSAERLKTLDAAMDQWVLEGWMNGGAALIIRNGKIAYYKAAGYNDLETKEPLKKDGIFRIASQTKAITSVAIMMLFDEGKILLTDPVSKYIPSFKSMTVLDKFNPADSSYTTVPASRTITIKDLLTHTSGLGYAQIGSKEATAIYGKSKLTVGLGVTNETLLSAMTRLGTLPLMHQPGEKWTYGLNTDVLGCIIELVSGTTLDQFFKRRIFEPLGMKDTYFSLPKEKASRLVALHVELPSGKLVKAQNNLLNGPTAANYPLQGSTYYSGGGGLSSTVYDYAIFLQMLLHGGEYNGKRILGRNTVRMMTMNQIGDLSRGDDKFGLGFHIVTEKGSANAPANEGTFSWGGAFATSYWVDPKEKIVMLLYRQIQNSRQSHVNERFRALAYQAIDK